MFSPLPASGEGLGVGFVALVTSPPTPSPLAERGASKRPTFLCKVVLLQRSHSSITTRATVGIISRSFA